MPNLTHRKPHPVWAHLTAILTVSIWGTTFVSSKVLLNHGMDPADIFFYRFLMAYLFIWIPAPKRLWSDSLRDELTMLLLGITGGSVYFLAENMALQYSMVTNVSIIVCSCPLLTSLLLACFYQNERMNRKQVLGSLMAFAGMILVVLNGQLLFKLSPKGDLLALTAALLWAFYSLLMKTVMHKYSSWFITRKIFFYGLLTILPYYAFVSPLKMDRELLATPAVWGNLLYLGLLASLLCYAMWNWVMLRIGAVKASNYLYLNPLMAMLTASIVLSERITWVALSGTLLLILGMIRAEKK